MLLPQENCKKCKIRTLRTCWEYWRFWILYFLQIRSSRVIGVYRCSIKKRKHLCRSLFLSKVVSLNRWLLLPDTLQKPWKPMFPSLTKSKCYRRDLRQFKWIPRGSAIEIWASLSCSKVRFRIKSLLSLVFIEF